MSKKCKWQKKLRKDIIEQNQKKINKILVEINAIQSKIKELRNYNKNSFDKDIQKEKNNSRSLRFRVAFIEQTISNSFNKL